MSKKAPAVPTVKDLTSDNLMSRSYAHDLVSGARLPSIKMAAKIERKLGLPATFWIRRANELAAKSS